MSEARPLPPEADFIQRFGGGVVSTTQLRALYVVLVRLVAAPGEGRLIELCQWLLRGPSLDPETPAPLVRLRLLLDALDAMPACATALERTLDAALLDKDLLPLLELGLPNDRGLWRESADRLALRLLPRFEHERDASTLIGRLFPRQRDCTWLSAIDGDAARRIAARVSPALGARLRAACLDVLALSANRTAALGLSREIRERSPEGALAVSPFFLLPRLCDALFSGIGSSASCREQIAACRQTMEAVLSHLEEFGVSVDVVYRIEVIGYNLDRIGQLLDALERDAHAGATVAAELVSARARRGSIRDLVRQNAHLLARKIIERAGQTGEHYITATRRQYAAMIGSAGGGGMLTAGTTALKYVIGWGHYPLFIEGLFASTNYALSFLVMQLFGFTLATKQPSMTAAALAHSLHGSKREPKLDELVTLIARICRSQFAAAIGNVGMVAPAAIGFHLLCQHLTGHPFLTPENAEHTIESLRPNGSTIFFAALTGVFLWLSSLGAGWLENWVTYHRLLDAVAQRRPRRLTAWLRDSLKHGISGIGGNVTLGFLLGMLPVIGKFFGVPLEVRHVTLSTGALTLAVCALGREALGRGLLGSMLGIVIILALNFGVSFLLALGVALRARAIEHAGVRVFRAAAARFFQRPSEFFFPPAELG